ncbi:MAG: hypothetical protein ACI3V5_11290 [Faecousia sp.]
MEEKFIAAWSASREKAEALGIRMRPVPAQDAMKSAHRALSGRRLSDGFNLLQQKGRLDLTLEALAVDKRFTSLFTDEEANEALTRLLEAGYFAG